jgi:hypothetical protein
MSSQLYKIKHYGQRKVSPYMVRHIISSTEYDYKYDYMLY